MSDCLSYTKKWFPDQLTDPPTTPWTNQPTNWNDRTSFEKEQFKHFEKMRGTFDDRLKTISLQTLDQGSRSLLHMAHKKFGLVLSGNLIQQKMQVLPVFICFYY